MSNAPDPRLIRLLSAMRAVSGGDLRRRVVPSGDDEIAEICALFNEMAERERHLSAQLARVADAVGREGRLSERLTPPDAAGGGRASTDAANALLDRLTAPLLDTRRVIEAVARGDLTRRMRVEAGGDVAALAETVNEMVDTLSAFTAEVTRVAREVGSEGILGGQAEVEGMAGTWRKLTESVNRLAGNLTAQVRAIAGVVTAVTEGDLTRRITVDAPGEVAELKDDINRMIEYLSETTRANEERTWLGRHLARISGLLQGHRNLAAMAQLVMNELTPLAGAQQGAFFLAETADGPVLAGEPVADCDIRLRMIAGYACPYPPGGEPLYALGQSLVGQVAATRQTIEVDGAPDDYTRISSGTGESRKVGVILLPVQYEGQILGVIELAAVGGFTPVRRELLEQLKETIGVAVNTITTSARTDELLRESQRLTAELRERQAQLQASNSELEEKAELLERQNADIELKTAQIEQARAALQERAQQLALASRVKSEFMANMSHELRTPLGSLLILAELLAQNTEGNLSARQVDFARTIYSAGSDLLQLINDILDLSRVEAGRMEVRAERLPLAKLVDYVEATFRPLAGEKGLELTVALAADAPEAIVTDEQRIQQILRNLLSNAVKFTDHGRVSLVAGPDPDAPGIVKFEVTDTGVGIPQDKLRVIFEAFQQADGTTSRQFGGTGLGLSISRELTQLLGGDLQVRSTLGRGSTFTLRLPVAPAAERTDAGPDSEAARSRLASPAAAVILVVERGEDGALSRAAETTVEGLAGVKEPVEVVAAPGAGAIASALAGRTAIAVLLDQATAEADAEAVADELAEAGPDLLVLVVGAAPDGVAAERLAAAGAGRHRIEPVSSLPQATERLTLHLLTTLPRTDDVLSEREPGLAPLHFRGEKVLIVDDDIRTVFALTSALELHGLTVIHAENGLRALDLLKQQPDVALVLMDLMMPGMDGYATTQRIRATAELADLPIIAVTAKAMREDREKSLAAGTNEHVTKPVDVAALLELIRRMISESAAADSPFAGTRPSLAEPPS